MPNLIIKSRHKLVGRIFVYAVSLIWLVGCIYAAIYEDQAFKMSLIALAPLVLAFIEYRFELKVYDDRIVQRWLLLKTIYYRDIEEVCLSGEWDPYRIRIYERGSSMPGIGIPWGVRDWRQLGAALIAQLPEEVKITGNEKLKEELKDVHATAHD